MRGHLRGIAATLPLLLFAPPVASAQSVGQVVDQMYAAYERYAAGVDNYTLVQDAMGFETTSYFEKEMVDGKPVFRMLQSSANGFNMSLAADEGVGYGDVFLFGPDLVEHARYEGRQDIGGRSVHVLAIDDLSAIDLTGPSSPDQDMDFVGKSARMFIDAETMAPRRMEFEGEVTTDDGVHEVTSVIDMEDYRDVQGLLIPYRTVMRLDGLQAMVDPEMAAQMEEMKKQLESIPEAQRAMVEQMMGGQMQRLQDMMSGSEPMSFEVTVKEVRVNAGPPRE